MRVPGGIRQTEKTGQGRGMENGRCAVILPSVGHLQLITTLKIDRQHAERTSNGKPQRKFKTLCIEYLKRAMK